MREIFVDAGRQIALVLTLPEQNLSKIAATMRLTKEVEFGVADLLSLEPLDEKNRPLRLNKHVLDDQLWERTYVINLPKEKQAEAVLV